MFSDKFNEYLFRFFHELVNDFMFVHILSKVFFTNALSIFHFYNDTSPANLAKMKPINNFVFHCFAPESFKIAFVCGFKVSQVAANLSHEINLLTIKYLDEPNFDLQQYLFGWIPSHEYIRFCFQEKSAFLLQEYMNTFFQLEAKNEALNPSDPQDGVQRSDVSNLILLLFVLYLDFIDQSSLLQLNLAPFIKIFCSLFSDRTRFPNKFLSPQISFHLLLHNHFFLLAAKHTSGLKSILQTEVSKNGMSLQDFIQSFLYYPINLDFRSILCIINDKPCLNQTLLIKIINYLHPKNALGLHYSFFLGIQLLSGFLPDKNFLIQMLFNHTSNILVILLYISSIILYRPTLVYDAESIIRDIIVSSLYLNKVSVTELMNLIPSFNLSTSISEKLIPQVSTLLFFNETYYLCLNESVEPNIYSPFTSFKVKLNYLSNYIQKKPNQLLPFYAFEDPPFELDLFSFLTSKTLFDLYFNVLFDYVFKVDKIIPEIILIVFDHFRWLLQKHPVPIFLDGSCAQTQNVFYDFLSTPRLSEGKSISPLMLIQKTGKLGEHFLSEIRTTSNESTSFLASSLEFLESTKLSREKTSDSANKMSKCCFENEEDSAFECTICHANVDDDPFSIPVSASSTTLFSFLDKIPSLDVLFMSSCNHVFHYKCLSQCKSECPICRRSFDFVLPIVKLYSSSNDAVDSFLETRGSSLFLSFVFLFTLIDFRERNIHSTLSKKNYSLICSSIYSLLFILNQQNKLLDELKTPFSTMIFNSLQTTDHSISFNIDGLSNEEIYVLMRRTFFFEVFALSVPVNIDVDINFECLVQRYHLDCQTSFLSNEILIRFPKNIVDFVAHYDLVDQSFERVICLIDGKIITIFQASGLNQCLETFILEAYPQSNFPIPFMFASGDTFLQVFFYELNLNFIQFHPIYVDAIGIPNVGMNRRESKLFLSEERFANLVDCFLTLQSEISADNQKR